MPWMRTALPGFALLFTACSSPPIDSTLDGAADGSALPSGDGAAPFDGGLFGPPPPCLASVTAPAAGGKFIYVSPGGNDQAAGTSPATALKSITTALGKASPGDVVQLAPGGTFNEPVTFTKGGTSGRPLVLSSDPQNRARIVTPTAKSAIAISNTGFVTVENLSLVGPGMELIKKPPSCLEYVLVHELVHLVARNHDRRFQSLMDQHLPTWRQRRSELNATLLAPEAWGWSASS